MENDCETLHVIRAGKDKLNVPKANPGGLYKFGKLVIGILLLFAVSLGAYYTSKPKEVTVPRADNISDKEVKPVDFVTTYPLNINYPIVNLEISGHSVLGNGISFIRVVLVTKDKKEYLVYENYTQMAGSLVENVNNFCDESCVLPSVVPDHLRIEGNTGSSFTVLGVTNNSIYKGVNLNAQGLDLNNKFKENKKEKDTEKLEKVKKKIAENKLRWTAGVSELSEMTYAEKRLVFNLGNPDHLPNIQGFPYYSSGYFEVNLPEPKNVKGDSSLSYPATYDYRNFQGENWVTPLRTKQKSCGSCAVFATIGMFESFLNLYYNQHLDLDLSEQDIINCATGDCTYGWYYGDIVSYMSGTGVINEACAPYLGPIGVCTNKAITCPDWQSKVTKSRPQFDYDIFFSDPNPDLGFNGLYTDMNFINYIKKMLVNNGPSYAELPGIGHAMELVGWETDPIDGGVWWIYRDSYFHDLNGDRRPDSGNPEAAFTKLRQFDPINYNYDTYPWYIRGVGGFNFPGLVLYNPKNPSVQPTVYCTDKDNDGYCYWGVGSIKADNCPVSCSNNFQKDCNDSDPSAFAFDSYYNCTYSNQNDQTPTPTLLPTATPITTLTPTPIITSTPTSIPGSTYNFEVKVYSTFGSTPVSGATVTLKVGKKVIVSKKTSSSGSVTFTNLSANNYNLSVSAKNYLNYSTIYTLNSNSSYTVLLQKK